MRVRRLSIERFRGIEFLELFPAARTVLVGPNNSGKSTVLEALDLLLHSGAGRPRPGPAEIDYFDRDPAAGFRIEVVLGGLDAAFSADVHEALEGWRAASNELVAEPDGEGVEPVVRVEVQGTPDFELVHAFAKPEMNGARFGRASRVRIGWVFDGRAREPSRQLGFYQGGLLDQLFAGLELGPAVDALRSAIESGADTINDDAVIGPELVALAEDLSGLGLLDEGAPEFEAGAISQRELLQALRLAMPGHGDRPIPLLRQGRGTQRLLVLAILLRVARSRRGPVLIGGFEEPEEALEPLRQSQAARMLAGLADAGGQIFLATHSPDVVRGFALNDIVLISPGPRPRLWPLAQTLSGPARHGLERRIDGPLVRSLFLPIPVVVEGPSDRAVFQVFWDALASDSRVRAGDHIGIEAVSAEGITLMPLSIQILAEAGKEVVAWLERDDPRGQVVVDQGHARCVLLYPDNPDRNNLERLLAQAYSLDALAAGMSALAADRGDDWNSQRDDLTRRATSAVGDPAARAGVAAAPDLRAALAAPVEGEARALVAACLSAKSAPAPFEIKGARAARVFAEALVAADGVAEPFARSFVQLGAWSLTDPPRANLQIQM